MKQNFLNIFLVVLISNSLIITQCQITEDTSSPAPTSIKPTDSSPSSSPTTSFIPKSTTEIPVDGLFYGKEILFFGS